MLRGLGVGDAAHGDEKQLALLGERTQQLTALSGRKRDGTFGFG